MLESKSRRRRSTLMGTTAESSPGGGVASLERSPSLTSSQSQRQQREAMVLTQEILMQALSEIRPSVSEKEREKYSQL